MKNPLSSPFVAVFRNEVLLNSKRIAPYFMALLCAGFGVLWWGWGPAIGRGVAINSDFFIAGMLPPYSFLFLPLFTAVFMADPVSRDFRCGIDPLIFSKPISRAEYLLGKFFGNFFVLTCCQSTMLVMWFALQAVPKEGLVTLPGITVVPYIKHFLMLLVISHLGLAAFYFAVGVLTRNPKIVYGLGVAFYPVYITYQTVLLSSLSWSWKLALDPLVMNRGDVHVPRSKAAFVNQLVVTYPPDLIINRLVMILLAAICLTIVYRRFSTSERSKNVETFSLLNLSTAAEGVYYPESSAPLGDEFERPDYKARPVLAVRVPEVVRVNDGIRATLHKLIATLGVEFRLLVAERSLVVVMPLAIFLSILEVAFYNIPPDVSHSAAYATNTAKLLLLFLIGIAVFYTGEAMHRDREVKIESVIWSTPVRNSVLLLSKCFATIVLTFSLVAVVGLLAIVVQLLRGHMPVDVWAYVKVYGVVLIPGIVFMISFVVALNVLLRNKYAAYVIAIGTGAGLFYLYSMGYKHWLYNPLLYQLWKYPDLTSGKILAYRLYWLALAVVCVGLAYVLFERKSKNRMLSGS
jgi:ABC-2 type transport system permease protein